jgi:hypothetical protein
MTAIDALAFWLRRQSTFWMMTLPIAALAAATAYVFETRREYVDWQHHWGWGVLFALIYAMFLDRWIKEALLDDALPCDEVDALRRSIIAVRFLTFALALSVFAIANPCPYVELNIVACAAVTALFVLLLPALAAHHPLSLYEAFMLGRPVQVHLFLLIGGSILLSLLAGQGLAWAAHLLPSKPWNPAAVAALQRTFDCMLLAFVGYGLAHIFRKVTDWQPPESADQPFPGLRLRTRKA